MSGPRVIPLEQFRSEACPKPEDSRFAGGVPGKHKIWCNMLGDGYNYFCANGCKTYSDDPIPAEEWENF